jgi:hypothetical protein
LAYCQQAKPASEAEELRAPHDLSPREWESHRLSPDYMFVAGVGGGEFHGYESVSSYSERPVSTAL